MGGSSNARTASVCPIPFTYLVAPVEETILCKPWFEPEKRIGHVWPRVVRANSVRVLHRLGTHKSRNILLFFPNLGYTIIFLLSDTSGPFTLSTLLVLLQGTLKWRRGWLRRTMAGELLSVTVWRTNIKEPTRHKVLTTLCVSPSETGLVPRLTHV